MKIIDKYNLKGNHITILVKIIKDEKSFVSTYEASFPEVGKGTRISLDEIKLEILSQSKTPLEKLVDLKFIKQVRKDFSELANKLLSEKIPRIDKTNKHID